MRNILFTLLAIAATFSVSQWVFNPLRLYYEIWWLDIPMHILGGFLFSLLFLSFLEYFSSNGKVNSKIQKNKKVLLLFVFFIGLVWEIYEYSMYVYFNYDWGGIYDTIKDLCDDMLGALIGLYLYNKNKN